MPGFIAYTLLLEYYARPGSITSIMPAVIAKTWRDTGHKARLVPGVRRGGGGRPARGRARPPRGPGGVTILTEPNGVGVRRST